MPKLGLLGENADIFIKSLDLGNVTQIPGVPDVSRTMTGLVSMIIDLHLKVPHLSRKFGSMKMKIVLFVSIQMMVHPRQVSYQC